MDGDNSVSLQEWRALGNICWRLLHTETDHQHRKCGQLFEIGFQTIIEGGVMRICDVDHHLLAKVIRASNRLYVLNVELAAPVCPTSRGESQCGCGIPGTNTLIS
jgi:hypothetical protein